VAADDNMDTTDCHMNLRREALGRQFLLYHVPDSVSRVLEFVHGQLDVTQDGRAT
jgi:hypothetical protein